jgi:hypothetical protein
MRSRRLAGLTLAAFAVLLAAYCWLQRGFATAPARLF